MEHQLCVIARFRPEVFERILRVVRHRGFRLSSMSMTEENQGSRVNMLLTVTSERSIDLLSNQLSKLMDVDSVEIQQ